MAKEWKRPKKIVFASQNEVGYYKIWVEEIILVMCEVTGEPKPLFISDESIIGDMPLEKKDLKKMAEILGIDIKAKDLILDLAKRLKKSCE